MPSKFTAISDAFEADDAERVAELAHALAGSGGTFGFPEVTDAARAIEHADDDAARQEAFQALGALVKSIASP